MRYLLLFVLLLAAGAGIFLYTTLSQRITIPSLERENTTKSDGASTPSLTVVATGLEVPWSLAFLPDESMLVTERIGRVRLVLKDGVVQDNPLLELSVVKKIQGEGGLHGIVLHPDFKNNSFVYVYYTYENTGNQSLNRVARYVLKDNALSGEKIIVDKIPGALFHDGGRIKFGPDNNLYITTGDAQEPSLSQDKNSLAGKILRVTDEGAVPAGNPFNTLVYSYGHRNPQGIAWDDAKRLWLTEHGPSGSGVNSGRDELNLIKPGGNYGWPTITGDQVQNGMESPKIQSGSDTWAPGGLAFLNGSLYFAGLRGEALYEAVVSGEKVTLKTHLKNQIGRIRDVVVGPDNMLYITTSNRDGRGIPGVGDDRIIRVNPDKLSKTTDYHASFVIFTNGIQRIFTDKKYHNLSEDVFIEEDNSHLLHIQKENVTWGEFFKTLPMSVTKECLTTGTNQKFCTSATQTLTFYINGKRDDIALEKEIQENDQLLISYGSENSELIKQQLQILQLLPKE